MSHVTKHHTEENWNGREHEDRRKDLIIFGNGVQLSENVDFVKTRQPRHDRSWFFLILEGNQSNRQIRYGFIIWNVNGE